MILDVDLGRAIILIQSIHLKFLISFQCSAFFNPVCMLILRFDFSYQFINSNYVRIIF